MARVRLSDRVHITQSATNNALTRHGRRRDVSKRCRCCNLSPIDVNNSLTHCTAHDQQLISSLLGENLVSHSSTSWWGLKAKKIFKFGSCFIQHRRLIRCDIVECTRARFKDVLKQSIVNVKEIHDNPLELFSTHTARQIARRKSKCVNMYEKNT